MNLFHVYRAALKEQEGASKDSDALSKLDKLDQASFYSSIFSSRLVHETTISTSPWMISHLAEHPTIWSLERSRVTSGLNVLFNLQQQMRKTRKR